MKKLIGVTAVIAIVASLGVASSASAKANPFAAFQSPSGNIGCYVYKGGARCDVAEHTWVSPSKPADCDVDYGNGVAVGKKSKAGYVCAGDTALHQGKKLGYGKSVKRGHFKCKSIFTGMRCLNTKNKHGFKVSRDNVHLF